MPHDAKLEDLLEPLRAQISHFLALQRPERASGKVQGWDSIDAAKQELLDGVARL